MSQDDSESTTTTTMGKQRVEQKIRIANSYEDYEQILRDNLHAKPIRLLFLASPSPASGYSWNPLCVEVCEFLENHINNMIHGILVMVYVGSEEDWEDQSNPFRKDEELNLRVLPTLMRFDTHKKLEGYFCLKQELVDLLFQDNESDE